jgi:hypothetical protein
MKKFLLIAAALLTSLGVQAASFSCPAPLAQIICGGGGGGGASLPGISNSRTLYDVALTTATDWNGRYLIDSSNRNSIAWDQRNLIDSNILISLDYDGRRLLARDGLTQMLQWDAGGLITISTPVLSGSSITAAYFIGDGSGLTGLPTPLVGNTVSSSWTVTGAGGVLVVGDSVTAGAFYGDGSHLTGISGGGGVLNSNDSYLPFAVAPFSIAATWTLIAGSSTSLTVGTAGNKITGYVNTGFYAPAGGIIAERIMLDGVEQTPGPTNPFGGNLFFTTGGVDSGNMSFTTLAVPAGVSWVWLEAQGPTTTQFNPYNTGNVLHIQEGH